MSSIGVGADKVVVELVTTDKRNHRVWSEQAFSVSHYFRDGTAAKIVCKRCKSDRFEVGIDNYDIVVNCVNCGVEICVHRE